MLIIALAAAVAASGPITKPVTVNADADAANERLIPEAFEDRHGVELRRVVLEDACGRFRLIGAHDYVAVLRAREMDGATAQPEVFAESRSGAAGRVGTTKIVRYTCGRPRTLFAYDTLRPSFRPPRGYYVTSHGVKVRPGRLTLTEYLAKDDMPSIATSHQRVSRWRYADGRFRRVGSRFSKM